MQMMQQMQQMQQLIQQLQQRPQNAPSNAPGIDADGDFTFGEESEREMHSAFNDVTDCKLDVILPNAFGSMYTGLLDNHKRNITNSVHKALNRMNFVVCGFVNKTTGDRCTMLPTRDRKTGEKGKYCIKHKYMCEKNDRLKFLDEVLSQQPNLIRKETEYKEQRSREVSRARHSDDGSIFSTGARRRVNGPTVTSAPTSANTSRHSRQNASSRQVGPTPSSVGPTTNSPNSPDSGIDTISEILNNLGIEAGMDTSSSGS